MLNNTVIVEGKSYFVDHDKGLLINVTDPEDTILLEDYEDWLWEQGL